MPFGEPQHAFEPRDADPRPAAAAFGERRRHRLAPASLAGRADVGDPVLRRPPEFHPLGLADDRGGGSPSAGKIAAAAVPPPPIVVR